MRLAEPRITTLEKSEWTDEQAALLAPYETPVGVLNIYRTLGRKPKAARAFLTWGRYVLRESSLGDRLKEMVILRIGWLCKSGYEFAQHSRLAARAGMTAEEIERIKAGPDADGWINEERAILKAAGELHATHFISDDTWRSLGAFLSDEQRMDLVYIIGHYTQVCMILNTFGIQLEGNQPLDPSLRA